MLGQRLRRWPNNEPTLNKCTMFERKASCSPANTRHLYNIYTTFSKLVQHCMKSYKCFVFTECQYKLLGSSSFQIPAVIQSVCLQASDQKGARAKGFVLLTHRCRWSIYELAVIWELALNEAFVWNAYLVLLWNRALAYPQALLPSGGPLSREFWQLTTPLNQLDKNKQLSIQCCVNVH